MKQIVVSFPPQPNIDRSEISGLVNRCLSDMQVDIFSWNAFVEMRNTENGNFMLIAKCDNEEIRSKMQWQLNIELNKRNAA